MKRTYDSYNNTTSSGGYRGSFPHGGQYPPGFKKYRREDVDPVNPTPSKVLHVRNLAQDTTEADLLAALSPFGNVAYTTMMGNGHMALAEFVTMEEARACIAYSKNHQINVKNHPVLINYSTSEKIQRSGLESEEPNKVLVLTISNVTYPITVDTLKEICTEYGEVLRIALIKRPGILQALVEFENSEQATKAKFQLNGADIYDNACTLKVEYGRMDAVKVTANNADQWDYTCDPSKKPENQKQDDTGDEQIYEDTDNSSSWRTGQSKKHESDSNYMQPNSFSSGGGGYFPSVDNTYRGRGSHRGRGASRGGTYIPDDMRQGFFNSESSYGPPRGSFRGGRGTRGSSSWEDSYGTGVYGRGAGYSDRGGRGSHRGATSSSSYHERYESRDYNNKERNYQDDRHHNQQSRYHDNYSDDKHNDNQALNGSVVMVYGVDAKEINCDRLFNLLCCYGNCLKIKIMMSKPDTCMAQMGSPHEAASVIDHLQDVELFGKKLSFRPSKQNVVHDVPEPHPLSDGSPAFKDYSSSTVHRFNTQEEAAENIIVFPIEELYWQNAPAIVNEDVMKKLFAQKQSPIPTSVKVLRSTPTSSGILKFENLRTATEALMLCNNMVISGGGSSMPYVFKLCYAAPEHRN